MGKISREARKSGCCNPYNERNHGTRQVLKTLRKVNQEYLLKCKEHYPLISESNYICSHCKKSVDAYLKRLNHQTLEV
jgi:hypothetical protein